jgi:hypothetical protein
VTQGPMAPRMSATAPMVIAVGVLNLLNMGSRFEI